MWATAHERCAVTEDHMHERVNQRSNETNQEPVTRKRRIRPPSRDAMVASLLVVAGVGASYLVSQLVDVVSPLIVAIVLGVAVRNVGVLPSSVGAALGKGTKRLLRAGVVLLGLQLAVPELLELSASHLIVVTVTVVVTFVTTRMVGHWLRVGRERSLLLATGFSICGASAIAAVSSVVDADEDDVAATIAMVTLYGTLAIAGFPLLQDALGLNDREFGVWVGASVHEVAQVVAAAAVAGEAALVVAVLAKLGRVVLLAPTVTLVALAERRRASADRSRGRPPIIPVFVLGFLAMAALRSTGVVPSDVVSAADVVTTLLLAGAMFGLGAGVHVGTLVRTGGRAAALGAVSTVIAATVAYVGLIVAR